MNKHDAIKRTNVLNKAEIRYRKEKGVNPAFPWSSWGDRPRAGALWTSKEINALTMSIENFKGVLLDYQKLGVNHICALAWTHGRSANGVNEKIYTLLGPKEYFSLFDLGV